MATAPKTSSAPAAIASRLTVRSRLLLRGRYELAVPLPLLAPSLGELLAPLELDVVAEAPDERPEGRIIADLLERGLELLHDRLGCALGRQHRPPHREDHVQAFLF